MMKVEIWSDVICPFCYIGKRNFETALKNFVHSSETEVEWKSFQLDPEMPEFSERMNVYQYLAERKGITFEHSVEMHRSVEQMAAKVGLNYNFEKAVVANSFNAHQLIHLAKKHGLGDKAEEILFRSYFTDGINISDKTALLKMGTEIGLEISEINEILESNNLSDEVNNDIKEARQLNINAVPFFVFNRKYGVSGAQSPETFLQVLSKSFDEWKVNQK